MHTIHSAESLSTAEQDVLTIAGRNGGKIEVASRSDTRGPAVRAGKEKLYDPQDLSYAQHCCNAIPNLIELQLLRTGTTPKHYELTNFGWQISRKLTLKAKNAETPSVNNPEPTIP
jgi:hypothetical protein